MKDKELVAKLNSIDIIPDKSWKEKNREIIFSQIFHNSASLDLDKSTGAGWLSFVFGKSFISILARPAATVMAIVVLVLGSGAWSLKAAQETKPGDSLYIAKIVSEKTKIAITFDDKKKTQLNLEFAASRTKEMAKVLEEEISEEIKMGKVNQLKEDFKKEISAARKNLEKVSKKSEGQPVAGQDNAREIGAADESDEVFSANMEKTDDGMEISIPKEPEAASQNNEEGEGVLEENLSESPTSNNPDQMIEKAEELFDQEDYAGALNKLEEANKAVGELEDEDQEEKVQGEAEAEEEGDSGEVKGETEDASGPVSAQAAKEKSGTASSTTQK